MSLTSAQQQAIDTRGNVLVVAGAGTGKTRTLVERCLSCLVRDKPPASLDEILMVTFTDAAAAEMRQRIRVRLESELAGDPGNPRWQEQLALFETAHIGTLHSFCLQLVRQHFYELELDPQLSVLAEEEARLLANETLESVLQAHYAGRTPAAEAVQELIEAQGRGGDQPIRSLVLRLHNYTQTRPDPGEWFDRQIAMFRASEPDQWQLWLRRGIADWRERWLPILEGKAAGNEVARAVAATLRQLEGGPSRDEAAAALESIIAARESCPRGKKTAWLKPLEEFLDDAEFLFSLARCGGGGPPPKAGEALRGEAPQAAGETPAPLDPLAEDWGWVRSQMTTLLELAREFNELFTEAKRELGAVDFHDLEQYALRLLWDTKANEPTRIARQWRQKLRFLFVDEYQDINAAQDKIIEALSREWAQANRFLVGDVKQSIYRFRLAEPKIFQGYAETWRNGKGQAIPLVENFRSREGILNFINSLFGLVMQPEIGGVRYDEQAQLHFGAREERRGLSAAADSAPCVELHLRLKGGAQQPERGEESAEALAEVADLEEADKEARLVALRLRELRARQRPVWDEKAKRFRPVQWSDMAVLLRAPTNKAESYAKEFSRLNVPLLVARGGFYESMEVSDLLSLLRLLDNPLQDLPLLAVMHSPLVGLTLDELAIIRLTAAKAPFWTALVRFEERAPRQVDALCAPETQGKGGPLTPALSPSEGERENPRQLSGKPKLMGRDGAKSEATPQARPNPGDASPITDHAETLIKVRTFLDRYARWRRVARQVSLSRCLEAVLSETHYGDWLLTQPRGEQRHANVQRLLSLTQQFDQFQRQGLFRFLRFIEAQEVAETEPEVAPVTEGEAVRLMSIHQSKGLEFPVVVVADLGKPFNVSDLRAEVILDEEYGLCPQIKPPHSGSRYPSLPYWLARQRQQREMLGEELRLLYVAMTRARDLLILSGSVSEKRFEQIWKADGEASAGALLSARSYADWLGCWFSRSAGSGAAAATQGTNGFLHWEMHDDRKLIEPGAEAALAEEPAGPALAEDPRLWEKLQQRLSWVYPFMAATRRPAKTSVTALRRRAAVQADEEAAPLLEVRSPKPEVRSGNSKPAARATGSTQDRSRATGADFGSAHHVFLQLVSLERAGSLDGLKQEAERLERQGALTPEEVALLDFKGLAGFWQSDLGRKVRAQAQFVRRELAFTARFSPKELARLTGEPSEPTLEEEFVVVQGVADLAVLLPQELWLIDFKTDAVGPNGLADKVKSYEPQLKLYALALSQIYRRPVSQCWLYFLTSQTATPIKPD